MHVEETFEGLRFSAARMCDPLHFPRRDLRRKAFLRTPVAKLPRDFFRRATAFTSIARCGWISQISTQFAPLFWPYHSATRRSGSAADTHRAHRKIPGAHAFDSSL